MPLHRYRRPRRDAAPPTSDQHLYRGRYSFRTSDLCRVKASGVVQGVSGSCVWAGQIAAVVQLISARVAPDGAFITKSITKQAFALLLPSPGLPDAGGLE